MKSSFRPRRSSALVRPLRDEIIVDQKESFHVHALNSTAVAVKVWKLADGTRTVPEIAPTPHGRSFLRSNLLGQGRCLSEDSPGRSKK